ncbi:hypothetical protein KRM28CT15_38480 [Krasilnikovia sp. M28-CT-15]
MTFASCGLLSPQPRIGERARICRFAPAGGAPEATLSNSWRTPLGRTVPAGVFAGNGQSGSVSTMSPSRPGQPGYCWPSRVLSGRPPGRSRNRIELAMGSPAVTGSSCASR